MSIDLIAIAEVLLQRGETKLVNELEILAFNITRRRAIKIERLKKKINQLQVYLDTNNDADPKYREQVKEDIADSIQRLNKLKGTNFVDKPNSITPPSTVTPDVEISPINVTTT